jgi:hypothetical protein
VNFVEKANEIMRRIQTIAPVPPSKIEAWCTIYLGFGEDELLDKINTEYDRDTTMVLASLIRELMGS